MPLVPNAGPITNLGREELLQGVIMPRLTGVNVVALVKPDGERYVFLYDDESSLETRRTLSRFAADPELSLTWGDAGVLVQKMLANAVAFGL